MFVENKPHGLNLRFYCWNRWHVWGIRLADHKQPTRCAARDQWGLTRSSRDETVGVYNEIARSGSEVEDPSEAESYIPAA